MTLKKKNINEHIQLLEPLHKKLLLLKNLDEKLTFLDAQKEIKKALEAFPFLKSFLEEQSEESKRVVKIIFLIGQENIVFKGLEFIEKRDEKLQSLIKSLIDLEKFYDSMGGVLGYYLTLLKLIIQETTDKSPSEEKVAYYKPEGLDVSKETSEVRQIVRLGIEHLNKVGILFPLGGAGDRLNLMDQETKEPLPAAQMMFLGYSLFEGLIRDIQGLEFLYYKLFGKQITLPVALMTSHEKNNHKRISQLIERGNEFCRDKESFKLFIQPLVPLVNVEGDFVMKEALTLYLKPGGHGAIWKAALDNGVFDWFERDKKNNLFIRQINNPIAGVDKGILALLGQGIHEHKSFGFASCPRRLNTEEGMNVLKEVKTRESSYEYGITNIEYTEFRALGIKDVAEDTLGLYSKYPSNTNILFGHIKAIKKALATCLLPGILINMKNSLLSWGDEENKAKPAGRLESTMQNIADFMSETFSYQIHPSQQTSLSTFLTYNKRCKTISVIKRTYIPGQLLNGTPEGCFFEITENYRDLLKNSCGVTVPKEQTENDYLLNGPNIFINFHPALGQLYSVIAQKIRRGVFAEKSTCFIEASEVELVELKLTGSLVIKADAVMGKKDIEGKIRYESERCGKCTLINVTVSNLGYGETIGTDAWKLNGEKKGALEIVLQGNGEFFAEDVSFIGDLYFEVPEGHRLVVYTQKGNEIAWHYEKIDKASWKWEYTFDEESHICLEKIKNP